MLHASRENVFVEGTFKSINHRKCSPAAITDCKEVIQCTENICTAQTAMHGSSCLYTGRCVDWTEMKSSRRVADRPAVQIGKTQRSSFMCIHVDDDDCEHGSAKQVVILLRPLLTPID